MKEKAMQLERFLQFVYQDKEHYASSIESSPWEEILIALTNAKTKYPTQQDLIQFYIDRHKKMGDANLSTIMDNGYDIDGLISDLQELKKHLYQ